MSDRTPHWRREVEEDDVLVWWEWGTGKVYEQPPLPFYTTPHPDKDFFGNTDDPYPIVYKMTWKEDCAAEDRRTQERDG